MSSLTLTLTGNSSQLRAEYFPSIDLSDGAYVCGLIDFQTFNSIPNVDTTNNLFYFGHRDIYNESNLVRTEVDNFDELEKNEKVETIEVRMEKGTRDNLIHKNYNLEIEEKSTPSVNLTKIKQQLQSIEIPVGSYEVDDISKFLKKNLQSKEVLLELMANKNTLQCELRCSQPIDFSKPRTIGPLLGFRNNTVLAEDKTHISPLPADILKINVIRIECDIVAGSYLNSKPSHTIHEFSPRVPPGYKIIEVPQNVIYFPVTVKNIHALNLSVIDQNNNFINFRGETITIRLHIKKLH